LQRVDRGDKPVKVHHANCRHVYINDPESHTHYVKIEF
jgi:hypothetical protein